MEEEEGVGVMRSNERMVGGGCLYCLLKVVLRLLKLRWLGHGQLYSSPGGGAVQQQGLLLRSLVLW